MRSTWPSRERPAGPGSRTRRCASTASPTRQCGRASMRAEQRNLDEQIAAAEAAEQARLTDPQATADRVVAQLTEMAANMKTMPTFALRQALSGLVEKVVVDMETKEAEMTLALPAWAMSARKGQEAMRLVGTSASSTYYETHRRITFVLAVADCRYVKGSHSVCFECRRRRVA